MNRLKPEVDDEPAAGNGCVPSFPVKKHPDQNL